MFTITAPEQFDGYLLAKHILDTTNVNVYNKMAHRNGQLEFSVDQTHVTDIQNAVNSYVYSAESYSMRDYMLATSTIIPT